MHNRHYYEDMDGSPDGVRHALRLGLVDFADAHALVDDLCHVSGLQEEKVRQLTQGKSANDETQKLSDAVDILMAKWRRTNRVSQTELEHLLKLGLREAEMHRAIQWRTLLREAILPLQMKE